MKKAISLFVIIMFIAPSIFGQTKGLIYDKLIKKGNEAYYNVPVGLCEDYPEETTTKEIMRNDMELLKNSGINLLRISFGWDAIEETKGNYNWLFWDDYVKMAVEEYGITLIPYVCYMPRWNSTGAQDTLWFWNYPPKEYEPFGDFMTHLVKRYSKWIKTWELWNEPDIWVYWRGTSEEFAKFVKIGSKAVRAADPEAKVVLGGLAHRVEFYRELFRDHGISPYVDIINCHNYFETWSGYPIENITSYINELHDIVQRYGNNQPIWMAEVGYSTWRMEGSKISADYNAYYDYEHTPEYQAVQIFKTLTLAVSTEKLSAITWYEIKDLPMVENVIGDNNNRNLGVAYYDHKPKPGLKALQFFNELFSIKYKNIGSKVEIEKPLESEVYAEAFENEDGTMMLVTWLQSNQFGKRTDDKTGHVKDTRKEKVSFEIPVGFKPKVTIYNELGEGRECKMVKYEDGKITLDDFQVEGGKIYIFSITK
ncbi:hypothetical protein APF79_06660 [bacterium BRH_c32]|nr:MAG: hypothetical protein APF79_06660 [bacterium BRH_c32]